MDIPFGRGKAGVARNLSDRENIVASGLAKTCQGGVAQCVGNEWWHARVFQSLRVLALGEPIVNMVGRVSGAWKYPAVFQLARSFPTGQQ